MSIENPTLVHFRHFSSLYTNEYRVSRYESFMQNKANLLDAQMNVSSVLTMNYKQITMNNANKNKPNTNPTCRGVASGEAGSNPISKAKKCTAWQEFESAMRL